MDGVEVNKMQLLWITNGQVRQLGKRAVCGVLAVGFLLCLVPLGWLYQSGLAGDELELAADSVDPLAVREALATADARIATLAGRLGELQGRLVRLESIGRQVGELAGFDEQLLDFDQPVAIGGPVEHELDVSLPVLISELRQYAARLDDRVVRFELLEQALLNSQIDAQRHPSGRPTRSGWLSSAYGYRNHPISGRRQLHQGVDLAGSKNDPIEAVASGLVTWSGPRSGYGTLIEIDHRNGYRTRYGHNQENLVNLGELVKQGQVIAKMGSTGRSTGPHVHFEVLKNGKKINPQKYLKGQRLAHLTH